MLFDPDRHEPLDAPPWNEASARHEITAIVQDTEAKLTPVTWWPPHPRDEGEDGATPSKTLYLGATGVLWALERLAGLGFATLTRSYDDLWRAALDDYAAQPDTGNDVPSWFLGRSFPLLMAMLRGPRDRRATAAEQLYEVIAANEANPTWEVLWGSPGTMLAALFAYEGTGEERWRDLYRRHGERLWDEWRLDEELGCYVWTQDLYGRVGVLFGAGHGFAGNAQALLRGRHAFTEERQALMIERATETTKRLAQRDGGRANWPVMRGSKMLLQWCHGAPGFLLSLSKPLAVGRDDELDRLFLAAGQLVWEAGPVKKGACFCHGTDGNGMALLTLFERTGDAAWLERARAFAMHAIAQSRANAAAHGMRRYTLWTGDLGLATFLAACIVGEPYTPTLDFV